MHNISRNRLSKVWVGFSVVAATQIGVMLPSFAQYQGNPGDIVVIGDSPNDWSRYRSFWLELLQAGSSEESANQSSSQSFDSSAREASPEELEAKLKKNLVVSNLEFKPILKLNGSSQVAGSLTNRNKKAVNVASVGFEIVDASGNLVRSGEAKPEPSSLAPGQTVTFTTDLLGLAPDSSYKIRLTKSPFVLRGGV